MKAPKIIDKTFDTLVEEDLKLAAEPAKNNPDWKWSHQEGDVGLALLKIFAHMREEVISRLNRVPEKNFTAFLDMLGIDLLEAQPARVPVTFCPTDGQTEDIFVPEGTQVAADETEKHGSETFETTENLYVTPTSITGIYSVNPLADEIFEHFKELREYNHFELFSGTNIQKHVLYLGHNELFKLKGQTTIKLSIEFDDQAPPIDLSQWVWRYWDGEKEIDFDVGMDAEDNGCITLTAPAGEAGEIKERKINDISCLWVEAELQTIDVSYSSLFIRDIRVSLDAEENSLLPDAGFYNSFAIDPSQTFYPFGPQPRIFDMFYLCSEEAFSKKGVRVAIGFTGTSELPDDSPILKWEYWNNTQWKTLPLLNDAFYPRMFNGCISFDVPLDFVETDVNGTTAYWIRARLMNNGYEYEEDSTKTKKICPPTVSSVTIGYALESESLQHCLTYNNLDLNDVTEALLGNKGFKPFTPLSDEMPAFYLGLEDPLSDGVYSLFFHLSDESQLEGKKAELIWQCLARDYSKEKVEHIIETKDCTENLSKSDVLQILGPSEHLSSSNFGSDCYWLKGVLSSDSVEDIMRPEIEGIYLNTAWAEQRETVQDEILGSSEGGKNSTYKFSRKPVISSDVWVKEGPVIHEDEEEEPLTQNVTDENGKTIDTWVKWTGVEDFFSSRPRSRHYVLDEASGQITFGDGIKGKVPPIGMDNIKATYRWGGGVIGNVDAKEINVLKSSIPGIDEVINHLPAGGGSDTESVSSVLERGPWIIKHRDRAVTLEDFERLAKASSSYIARAKCLTEGSRLKIIIIPPGEDSRPMPSLGLLDIVRKHLQDRCLCTLPSENIYIQGPDYREVVVSVDVTPTSIDKAVPLRSAIIKLLNNYLHPLTGGPDGTGWVFGRGVYISDVYAMLENIEGVDHVQNLELLNLNEYLFSWKEIPGRDDGRLLEFLTKKFGIDWIKTARLDKIDAKTIKLYTEEYSLYLKLNDKKTEMILEIDGRPDKTYKFVARLEDDELNIYLDGTTSDFSIGTSEIICSGNHRISIKLGA